MSTNTSVIVSTVDFRTAFSNFTIAVNNSKYNKIGYVTWKEIKKCIYNPEYENQKIIFYYNNDVINFSLNLFDEIKIYTFKVNDDSFGQFLYDTYFAIKQDNITVKTDDGEILTISPDGLNIRDLALSHEGKSAIWYMTMKNSEENTESIYDNFGESHKNYNTQTKDKKEKKSMKFNFDFGVIGKNDAVRMSPYGMAIKNNDNVFVAYDKNNETVVDVDVFNFDAGNLMYKMPVALKDVTIGDVVIHNHMPMFVTYVNGNTLEVVDIYHGENKSIIPTTNMFGFNFVTKVVSIIDMGTPDKDNPFGNMLPFLMLDNENADMKDVAMAMMFMNGNMNFTQNPMMMFMLMNKDNDSDMLPLMMAMNMNNFAGKPPVTAK